ncbi:unnamed protein product [Paramecium octaurelia]|uniref:GAF domain-containing protein n=1 Tax=Paramecium octaurelia TaxID=43137 RepID=A0A8S1XQX4_PAROT|nr:unnamed protein product [Paramecium octaurelia]
MSCNTYFLERPKIKLNKINQPQCTPKKQCDFSVQKFTKTQPDERTTTNNLSRRLDSSQDTNMILEQRLHWIDQLAESLKSNQSFEVGKILQSLQQMAVTLKQASKNEIELNQKNKLLNKSTLETISQKQIIQQLKEQQNHFKQDNIDQSKKLHLTQMEQQKLQRDYLYQKQLCEEYYKKVRSLEKRIEMILEKNLSTHQDELRMTLSELVKDNEQLKRNVIKREKEIERLKELNQKLIQQNNRLSKKLDNLKTKRVGTKSDNIVIEDNYVNNYVFDPNQLPQSLEFRLSQLTSEQNDFLIDLIEHGADVFTNQVIQLENMQQRKDLINLIANQFISQREFSEKINQIMNEFITLISYRNIKDFQIHVSKGFKMIFQTETVRLWIIDGMTCKAYTHDPNGQQQVALLTEGVFQKIVYENFGIKSPSKEQQLLYITEGSKIYGKNFLLLPIMMNTKKPCGLLEIQNINDDMIIDIQYYGLLVNMLSKSVITSILSYDALYKELKYQDLFYSSFIKLCQSTNFDDFEQRIQDSAYSIFQIAQTNLIHVEDNKFKKKGQYYDIRSGCAYQVYKSQRPQILTSITKHQNFDENIDISSILPVFAGPIIQDNQVVAILEFILKKKKLQDQHPFGLQIQIGFKVNSIDEDAQKFYDLASKAYCIAFKK